MLEWIQKGLEIYVSLGGRYLLPAVAIGLVILHHGLHGDSARRRLGPAALKTARVALLGILVAAAVLSIFVFSNFFNYHYGGYLNAYEFYHYYMGSKYSGELGYFDLYNATLVADEETGRLYRPSDGKIGDLRTHALFDMSFVLNDQQRYRSLFSQERWREFKKDTAFFKERLGRQAWNRVLRDKGYNATPVWTMVVGGILSNRISTDSPTGMTFLSLLDVLLLVAALASVAWVFGVWPSLLMVVFLSTSYLMAHVHMKGAFLRTDFIVCLILAVCLLKTGRYATAGALVAYSTLSRVFPVILIFGLAAKFIWELLPVAARAIAALRQRFGRAAGGAVVGGLIAAHALAGAALLGLLWTMLGGELREVLSDHASGMFLLALPLATISVAAASCGAWGFGKRLVGLRYPRFFGGFTLALAVLVAGSVVYGGGPGVWSDFARKMTLHRGQDHIWNVGFRSVVIADFEIARERDRNADGLSPADRVGWIRPVLNTDPGRGRSGTILAAQLAALLFCFFAVRGLEDDRALAFGFVPTFFLISPTYYYYIILLLPFLFFASRLQRRAETLGVIYLFFFGMAGFWLYYRWDQYFITYYWNSVMALLLALYMLAVAYARTRRVPRGADVGRDD